MRFQKVSLDRMFHLVSQTSHDVRVDRYLIVNFRDKSIKEYDNGFCLNKLWQAYPFSLDNERRFEIAIQSKIIRNPTEFSKSASNRLYISGYGGSD